MWEITGESSLKHIEQYNELILDRQFAQMASDDQKIIVGHSLSSCTKDVQASDPFVVEGRTVKLVDTPGFNDYDVRDTDVLQMTADWMNKAYFTPDAAHYCNRNRCIIGLR